MTDKELLRLAVFLAQGTYHRAASDEERRERRLEQYRTQAKRYRTLYPDKKREQDRRWRANNKEKNRAASNIRKQRAKARGYRWKPTAESIERHRARGRAVTASFRYLCSLGLIEWFGPKATSAARREAAYVFARQHGLLR